MKPAAPVVIELDPTDQFDSLVAECAKRAQSPGANARDQALLDLALVMYAVLKQERVPTPSPWARALTWAKKHIERIGR